MKKLAVLMILIMLITTVVIAQPPDEEPEPSWDNSLFGYECQIAVGSKVNLTWESVPVVWSRILPETFETDHFYGTIVLGGNRRTYWAGATPNGETIEIGIHMPPMPHWWGFYRARFRPFSISDPVAGEGWSEPSRWVSVIDLTVMPWIKAFAAMPEGGE